MSDDRCTEQPWYDEVGCDKSDDGVHRCHLPVGQHRRKHRCRCGAMVIEDA